MRVPGTALIAENAPSRDTAEWPSEVLRNEDHSDRPRITSHQSKVVQRLEPPHVSESPPPEWRDIEVTEVQAQIPAEETAIQPETSTKKSPGTGLPTSETVAADTSLSPHGYSARHRAGPGQCRPETADHLMAKVDWTSRSFHSIRFTTVLSRGTLSRGKGICTPATHGLSRGSQSDIVGGLPNEGTDNSEKCQEDV